MKFNWYKPVPKDEGVSQGDIILKCDIINLISSETEPFIDNENIIVDVIVMTQACDLEHSKVDKVTLCRLSPLKDILRELLLKEYPSGKQHENLLNGVPSSKITDKRKQIIQDLKKGAYLDFHLLNKCENAAGEKELDYNVVLLRESYTLPLDFINKNLQNMNYERFRLLPPYREHLSQAYARNFFRIGLPLDIDIQEGEL